MKIELVTAIILSERKGSEFVLHVPSEYDYRYQLDRREEFINTLQLRFSNINPQQTMKVYSVPVSLKNYTTTLKD